TLIYTLSLHDALPICPSPFSDNLNIFLITLALSSMRVKDFRSSLRASQQGAREVSLRSPIIARLPFHASFNLRAFVALSSWALRSEETRLNSSHVKIS